MNIIEKIANDMQKRSKKIPIHKVFVSSKESRQANAIMLSFRYDWTKVLSKEL